jgi:mRNA-decapping enzyme subunit 2
MASSGSVSASAGLPPTSGSTTATNNGNGTSSTASSSSSSSITVEKCLEDVEVRFLYCLPEEEFMQADRLFFQIEQAWWFYEDFYADKYEHLPHFKKLVRFAELIFLHCPLLHKLKHKFEELFAEFGNYKNQIPVYGCILLNPAMTKAVLVCSYHGNSWGFPRGKINEGESPMACAVRETYEETGFDAHALCKAEDFLVVVENEKICQLYIAPDVPETTVFETQCRKEVSKIEFHPLDNFPKSYGVLPFVPKLRRWINAHRKAAKRSTSRSNDSSLNSGNINNITPSRRDRRASPMNVGSATRLRGERGESAQFNSRNSDTFVEDGSKGWTAKDMFAANAKLTGRQFVYSGNPHEFGSSHPRFIDYRKVDQPDSYENGSRSLADGFVEPDVQYDSSVYRAKLYFPCPFVFDTADIMGAVDFHLNNTR